MKEQQQVPIHTEYIQIDQLLKLEGMVRRISSNLSMLVPLVKAIGPTILQICSCSMLRKLAL